MEKKLTTLLVFYEERKDIAHYLFFLNIKNPTEWCFFLHKTIFGQAYIYRHQHAESEHINEAAAKISVLLFLQLTESTLIDNSWVNVPETAVIRAGETNGHQIKLYIVLAIWKFHSFKSYLKYRSHDMLQPQSTILFEA